MRFALLAVVLVAISPVHAAVVTFEELEHTSGVDPITSGGFVFTAGGGQGVHVSDDIPWISQESMGNFLHIFTYPGSGSSLDITREDGLAFDLNSLDLLGQGASYWIRGYDAHDQQIASLSVYHGNWDTAVFNDDWNSVSKINIEDSVHSGWGGTYFGIPLDNFSATVVPIPAAAWLFGSALAGLGWIRRKQPI
jgi:hypothetical protein